MGLLNVPDHQPNRWLRDIPLFPADGDHTADAVETVLTDAWGTGDSDARESENW